MNIVPTRPMTKIASTLAATIARTSHHQSSVSSIGSAPSHAGERSPVDQQPLDPDVGDGAWPASTSSVMSAPAWLNGAQIVPRWTASSATSGSTIEPCTPTSLTSVPSATPDPLEVERMDVRARPDGERRQRGRLRRADRPVVQLAAHDEAES